MKSFQNWLQVLAILTSICSTSLSAFTPCPPLGPTVLPHASLLNSSAIQTALKIITATLDLRPSVDSISSTLGVNYNTTSFSISLFSTTENSQDANEPFFWQYHHTAPSLQKSASGVKSVNAHSIYRIGSLTKLFTVWTFLKNAGDTHWDEPVTKYIPELAKAAKSLDATDNPVDYVSWDEVTLGELASHMAGIGRDYAVEELSVVAPSIVSQLPPLNASRNPPCGVIPLCNRAQFFDGLTHRPPVYRTATTPVYSNAAFQILAYALEAITGKKFEAMLNQSILHPLKMSQTSLFTPENQTNGVIPVNETASWWAIDMGDLAPAGSMFSSLHDLSLAGASLLSSSLLSPAQARRWLKPVTHTSSASFSVGRPWEITMVPPSASGDRPAIEIYGKEGNLGHYSAYLALIPDYKVGLAVMAADDNVQPPIDGIVQYVIQSILPALQVAAQQQAQAEYGGNYTLSNNGMKASISITALDGLPGMAITAFNANGTDALALFALISGAEPNNLSLRLYPTNLHSKSSSGGSRVAFRAIAEDKQANSGGSWFDCLTWTGIDAPTYGGYGLDEFVFNLDKDGKAKSIEFLALGLQMSK